MNKRVKVIIMLIIVLLISGLCFPIISEAQMTPAEEIFQDPDYDYHEAVYQLFREEDVVSILANADTGKRDTFMERLSEDELYGLMLLYRYALVSATVQDCIQAEGGNSAKDEDSIKEKIEKELEFYGELINRLDETAKHPDADMEECVENDQIKSGADNQNDAGTEAGTESSPAEEYETNAGPEAENVDVQKSREQSAFAIFRETIMANDRDIEAYGGEINDFEGYAAYLKTKTDCNITELIRLLECMEEREEDSTGQTEAEVKVLLYSMYAEARKPDEKEESKEQDKTPLMRAAPSGIMGAVRAGSPANAVARIGSTYYTTFNSAFNALPNGGTLYVLRNCEATHIVTTKSFSIYPEGQNVKVTFNESKLEPAGIICTPQGTGNPTWTISGKDGYTITFDANKMGSSGVLSSHNAVIYLKSGARLTNSRGNGVWNELGTTNVYDGAWIYNNGSHGIATFGTVNIYGGKIYGNKYDGMRSQKAINVYGGEIYNNQECGVHVGEGSCTFTMTGGAIHDNITGVGNINGQGTIQISGGEIYHNKKNGISTQGRQMTITGTVRIHNNAESGVVIGGGTASVTGGSIFENPVSGIINRSTLNISGGEVYSNTAQNGAGIQNYGTLNMSGGSVTGNRAAGAGGGICLQAGSTLQLSGGTIRGNTAGSGKGVYHNGAAMKMSGNGAVDTGNDVYLCAGKYISVTGRLGGQHAAVLTPADYRNGRKAAEYACDNKKGSTCFRQFSLSPNGSYCLRPGDYQDSRSGASDGDIVLSTRYRARYQKNIDADIEDMPGETDKYWYETGSLSSLTPSSDLVKFRGWSENSSADTAQYQPGAELNSTVNKDITLYAVWKTKIKINYASNNNVQGQVKPDYVTWKDCTAGRGYTVRKNAEFTKYEREQSSFAGWDITSDAPAKTVRFPERQTSILSYEDLLRLAAEQQGSNYSNEEFLQEITLYAVWDEAPVISADGVSEFYEGTEVTKKMLLENIKASDREDGDISKSIRILQIKYADGKLSGGEKQKGQTDTWETDMPDDYTLDTWFMQMDPGDSPAVHEIKYAVTDSFGNETKYEWTVKVKYNEFPEIETEDWYFTLEEAKARAITEETLLRDAIFAGRVKAKDKEDDELYPGKIQENLQLLDFHAEDFVTFEESGYVVVTYCVKDSMGPGGEGKETFRQSTVHILKDGEVVKPEPVKYVRFINQEYYEKNLDSGNDKNGGLAADSKWYKDPVYKEKITGTWECKNGTGEIWEFNKNDVREVKNYVKKHGIGNSREEKALKQFVNSFGYARK